MKAKKTKASLDFGPPKNKNGSLSDIMTAKEQECYSNRYHDLGNQTAIDHFMNIG